MSNAKKIFGIVGVVLLVAGLVVAVLLVRQQQELRKNASPATTLTMAPSTQSPAIGDTFTVTVQADTTVNSLLAADLEVTFDSQKLTLDELKENTFLPNALKAATIDNALGTGKITLTANTATPAQGQGVLAVMKFRAKAAGTANIGFGSGTRASGKTDGVREDLVDLFQTKTPTRVTILAGVVPSPSPSPSPTASPSPGSSPHPSPSPTASPRPTASPSPTPGTGGNTSTSPTPTPTGSGSSSSTKPTINLPSNKVVTSGATITGTAKAGSTVTITIKSDPITVTVTADSAGKWSYTLPSSLAAGSHTITVTDSNGTLTDTFTISGTSGVVNPPADNIPVSGFGFPTFLGLGAGALLLVFGLLLAM